MKISHRLRHLAALLLIPFCADLQPAEAAERTQEANVVGAITFAIPPEELQESIPRAVRGSLLLADDDNIYFTSSQGGDGYGNIARLGEDGSASVLHTFENEEDGRSPFAGLIQASDGKLYGTTYYGGPENRGGVFSITLAGEFTSLYRFPENGKKGKFPYAELVQASDGNLYGTTRVGGQNDMGVVFRIALDGSGFTVLHHFSGSDGSDPQGVLVEDSDGRLYGTTMRGGSGNRGVIYRISTAGSYERLYSFPRLSAFNSVGLAINSTGANPRAGLLRTADGTFYGTTNQGGENGYGTLFRAEISGDSADVDPIHHFAGWSFGGGASTAALVLGPDGSFYGTSEAGGYADTGAVWRVAPDGSLALLHGYLGTVTDGKTPYASVLFAHDTLYAVSTTDNTVGAGSIVKLELGTGGVLPVEFTASQKTIQFGQSVELVWNAPDAVTCDKFSSWNESLNEEDPEHITPTSGTKTLSPGIGVFTYGLACTDAFDVIHNALVGVVVEPPNLQSVDGGAIIGGGEVSWLLLALLAALLFVKIFRETRFS